MDLDLQLIRQKTQEFYDKEEVDVGYRSRALEHILKQNSQNSELSPNSSNKIDMNVIERIKQMRS